MSDAFFRDANPTPNVIAARLALLLHKTPEEVRAMPMEDVDLILYFIRCENHKEKEQGRIQSEMRQFK